MIALALAFALVPPAVAPSRAPLPVLREVAALDGPAELDALAAACATTAEMIEVSRAAEAAGERDRAVWYAGLALGLAEDDQAERLARARWVEVRAAVGAPEADPSETLRGASKALLALGKSCHDHKLYANAADLLLQLDGTPYGEDARRRLASLFDPKNTKVVQALLDSGIPVAVERRARLSAKEIQKLDAAHADWSSPYEAEGQFYVVRTDMGYEMAHQMLDAMEQINGFYRKVYGLARGKKTRKCTVNVYKDRAEFDRYGEPGGETVVGFYRPDTNEVHTFDCGTVEWLGREELWTTLFHEASHQFTAEVWKLLIPGWLNEGTSSYFEGTRLEAGGLVTTNKIPVSLIGELMWYVGDGTESGAPAPGAPKLRDVVSYFSPGSYDGEYYPFGWGLVYFCRNYEDARSERVFEPVYEAFMQSYTKGSGEKNAFKRFEQFFVADAKAPGVTSFEEFETLWLGWIRALASVQFGGPEQADVLVAKGQAQLANGRPEFAVDSFRWATEKDPNHATAWLRLAEAAAHKKVGAKDAAVYAYRRLAALAQRRVDQGASLPHFDGTAAEAYAAALLGIKPLDDGVARTLRENQERIVSAALEAASAHVAADLVESALALLREADLLLDGEGRLRARIRALAEEHLAEGRLPRTLRAGAALEGWTPDDEGWRATDAGGLQHPGTDGLVTVRLDHAPPKVFRFEAQVEAKGEDSVFGLLFDGQAADETYFLVVPEAYMALVKYDSDPERAVKRGSHFVNLSVFPVRAPAMDGDGLNLALEVEHAELRCFVDGACVGSYAMPCEAVAGQVGVVADGGAVTFTDLRLVH